MALSPTKFNTTVQAIATGGASGTGLLLNADALRMVLYPTATAVVAADTNYAITMDGGAVELAATGGYTRGSGSVGGTAQITHSGSTSTLRATAEFGTPTWTATGGGMALRYFVLYDSTATSSAQNLLMFWDYGGTLTLADTDTLTITGPGSATGYATLA